MNEAGAQAMRLLLAPIKRGSPWARAFRALDQAILRHVGIEPTSCSIIALKSSVHFRADFGPLAERVIVAIAPGPVVADPAVLNFRHVRADIRRRLRVR